MKNSNNTFDHISIEKKWIDIWKERSLHSVDIHQASRPFYNLMMFPYPSAEGLHVGNMYAFTGSDIYGRYMRMKGYDVFEPIGLDGFGIHSENYALKIGRHPMDHAKITQERFYNQLHKIGSMFDWGKTLETYSPEYYKWTQWIFVQMFNHGLAYRKKASVNYCPGCKTVLADEQVINGKCERCGNIVENRLLEQWFFRITAYAEKLQSNIPALKWSKIVKTAQTNWIGKKSGINITYPVETSDGKHVCDIICFTTRPDTNFGATFVAIAPEHPVISQLSSVINSKQRALITTYIKNAKNINNEQRSAEGRKKTGVFTGLYCINKLNGYKMPLYIADFVLMGFGTGAVVGVPAHDKRDFEFAQVFHIPVIRVVKNDSSDGPITQIEQVQEDEGIMMNSDFLDGMDIHEATERMMDYMEKANMGKRLNSYHLRDWLISRQRYWGPPIPMIYCKECAKQKKGPQKEMPGWYSVPEDQLPVQLPRIEDYKPGNDGVAPLAKHKEFYITKCPGCGAQAVRETDVSDTFLDSSWYFLRYPSINPKSLLDRQAGEIRNPKQNNAKNNSNSNFEIRASNFSLPWNPEVTKKWLPVNMYTGGAEHSVLHLLYSRFITMALHAWGMLPFEEPFTEFFAHGLVIKDGAKMSKSKGNVINPDLYIETYGSDALRLYLMFMGPFWQGGDFRDSAMEGMSRWVGRIWRLVLSSVKQSMAHQQQGDKQSSVSNANIHRALQHLIKKVGDDVSKRRYNTAIAFMMEFTNLVSDNGNRLAVTEIETFLRILAPFAPFVTEELWQMIHGKQNNVHAWSVHQQPWPQYEQSELIDENTTIVIQINGVLRDTFSIPTKQSQNREILQTTAAGREKVKKYLIGSQVKKIIVVPGKLVNFVV